MNKYHELENIGRRLDALYFEAERLYVRLGGIAKDVEKLTARAETESAGEAATEINNGRGETG